MSSITDHIKEIHFTVCNIRSTIFIISKQNIISIQDQHYVLGSIEGRTLIVQYSITVFLRNLDFLQQDTLTISTTPGELTFLRFSSMSHHFDFQRFLILISLNMSSFKSALMHQGLLYIRKLILLLFLPQSSISVSVFDTAFYILNSFRFLRVLLLHQQLLHYLREVIFGRKNTYPQNYTDLIFLSLKQVLYLVSNCLPKKPHVVLNGSFQRKLDLGCWD